MDSDLEPQVFVQLQAQTSTLDLSDAEFTVKTTAAASRIKAFQHAQSTAADRALLLSLAAARLSTIAEDEHVDNRQTEDVGQTTISPRSDNVFPLAHPGRLIPLPFRALTEDTDSSLSDTASDVTARPSGEAESTAKDSAVNLTAQLAIKQTDGSYKDLTSQIAIKQTDGSYKDVDIREIAPFLFQGDGNAQQPSPEIAPWPYRQDVNAQLPQSEFQTPPSSLGLAGRASRVVPSKTKHARADIEKYRLTTTRRRSAIPKPITPRPRTSSLTGVFTPSPKLSRLKLRKISSKLSFSSLRKQSSKFDSSSESESSSQLGSSFPSATAERDCGFSNPTIGGTPYEEHACGPAPLTDLAEDDEDIDSCRKRRGLRPLTILTDALNLEFDPLPAIDAIMETPVTDERNTGTNHHDAPRNTSTETVMPAPDLNSPDRAESSDSEVRAVTSSSSEKTLATLHGDASVLFNSPPPLLSDHPINRSGENAFEIKTEYPLMTTSTPAPVIKALAKEMNQLSSKSAGFVDDLRKKKSYRNLGGLLARSAPPTRLAYGSELSPIVAAKNAALAQASNDSAPSTPSSTRAPKFESYDSRGKRLRKISTLFTKSPKDSDSATESPAANQTPASLSKAKDLQKPVEDKSGHASMEISKLRKKKQLPIDVPTNPTKSEHQYLEQFIRNHLAYHQKDNKPGKWPHYPPHPNDPDRAWDHANLRCQLCIPCFCGCCGKACCAYQAITLRLSLFSKESEENNGLKEMLAEVVPDPKVRPNPKEQTKELKDALDSIRPVNRGRILGGEAQTFLQCTECKKMTCPTCCGICPLEGCRDTVCRKCKGGDPWGPCTWHDKNSSRSSESKASTDKGPSMVPMTPLAQMLRKQLLTDLEERYAEEEKKGGPCAFWHRKT